VIGVIDYGLGNIASVIGAIERLNFEAEVTSDPLRLAQADKLILPGVGAYGDGMQNLRKRGLIELLEDLVRGQGKPILGICLGAQLFAHHSDEFGSHQGLGWLDAVVKPLQRGGLSLRVPHVGWDEMEHMRASILLEDVPNDALFYYVHSYYIEANDPEIVIGSCQYGNRFAALLQSDNVYAAQFHPEKSQRYGLTVLRNFLVKG